MKKKVYCPKECYESCDGNVCNECPAKGYPNRPITSGCKTFDEIFGKKVKP